jgi:membrane-associated phospholipid phosphatase
MKSLKVFTLLIVLYIGAGIITQEASAQQVSVSNQLPYNKLSFYDTCVNYQNYRNLSIPDKYSVSKQKLSGSNTKFVSVNKNVMPGNEYDVNVYKHEVIDAEINAVKPVKAVMLPVISDYTVVNGEEQVYKINPAVDIPIVAVGSVWSVYALSKVYTKTPPTVAEIQGLNKDNIPAFDRWSIYPYNDKLEKLSYYPFYASIPLPFIFFLSTNRTNNDFFKLSFLYWETISILGLVGTSSSYLVDRYRPYCYTNETPMDRRTSKVARNSFFSGHVEMVAAPLFFIAKVYSDYYPESNVKWVFYGFAASVTTFTAYTRLKGGDHFPSDILLGVLVGTLSGILVPELHKNKNSDLSVLPYGNEMAKGLSLTYQF